MAKVSAPKSAEYDARKVAVKRHNDISTIRAKANLSQVDKDKLLVLLMDDFLARNPAP